MFEDILKALEDERDYYRRLAQFERARGVEKAIEIVLEKFNVPVKPGRCLPANHPDKNS